MQLFVDPDYYASMELDVPGLFGLLLLDTGKRLPCAALENFVEIPNESIWCASSDAEKTNGYIARVSNPANQNPKVEDAEVLHQTWASPCV